MKVVYRYVGISTTIVYTALLCTRIDRCGNVQCFGDITEITDQHARILRKKRNTMSLFKTLWVRR